MIDDNAATMMPIGTWATMACTWEAAIPKPGNVHPTASFEDVRFVDFVTSAVIIGPSMERAAVVGVGQTVHSAVRATRAAVGTNTNLGTVLLLAPLAAVPRDTPLESGVHGVLDGLTSEDADLVYDAIRVAQPGGLGHVDRANILAGDSAPGGSLVAAMELVAASDLVARQYTNAFREVFQCAAPWIEQPMRSGVGLADAVGNCFLRLMAEYPDSLIARKCGSRIARQAADRAADVLSCGPVGSSDYRQSIAELDRWLRADGHRRNPGTSADMIAAGLFVLLREGRLIWPVVH